MSRSRRGWIATLFLAPLTAQAFVPAPSYVVARWAEKLKGVRTLHVRQRTTFLDPNLPGGSAVIEEEIWVRRPGYFRKASVFPRGKVDYLLTPQRALRVTAGKAEVAAPADLLGPVGTLFSLNDTRGIITLLRQAGVDPAPSKWALRDGAIDVEIGTGSANRLFFRKDVWTASGADWSARSYRFDRAPSARAAVPYPDSIEVSQGGKTVERTEVIAVEVNPAVSDAVFDLKALGREPKKPR